MAREVAQQGFGNLGIKVGLHPKSQHGGSNCHVEELDPEMHLSEGGSHIVGAVDDVRGEFSGRGQLSAKLVTQQPLVEALQVASNASSHLGSSTKVSSLEIARVMFPNGTVF